MCTVADKELEGVGYLLAQSFSNWWGLYALAWPVRQTRFVIHKLDLKDCHAVISIMRVSHYILNDVEQTAAITKKGTLWVL